jgi:predicted Ser/Thr protein kinase
MRRAYRNEMRLKYCIGILEEGVGPDGERVAIKKERISSPRITRPSLAHEYKIYKILEGHPQIPRVFAYGKHGNFDVMAMELLGATLGDRFRQCGKKFTLQYALILGLGMVCHSNIRTAFIYSIAIARCA